MARIAGTCEQTRTAGETVKAFVPAPLPPSNPPLNLEVELSALLQRAETALSRLRLAGSMVPSLDWLIYSFVRKEAVVSSQIEGTQATLFDLLMYEASVKADTVDDSDVRQVCNHVDALTHARKQIRSKNGLPLSMRLLNEAHRRLMKNVPDSDKRPGEIRRTQNWIGGTRSGNAVYVPPPPHVLGELLGSLENYIHTKDPLPPLVRAGLSHAQFETIHPYLDGNGRIGRLLITLLLEHWKLLDAPLLYLSLYFKRHRAEYYRRLNAVRTDGDFESWLKYFLEGVAVIADETVAMTQKLFALTSTDRAKVVAGSSTSVAGIRLFELLPSHPIITVAEAVKLLKTTKPTATKAVSGLVDAEVLVEVTGRRRDRAFSYEAYLNLLRAETDL
ncbi:MAG TPA: Fic family protein [Acidobacteriota bacterium]|nr:Fic family protein [Acidobacteriota bacterium]